jgi:hypothetical protein
VIRETHERYLIDHRSHMKKEREPETVNAQITNQLQQLCSAGISQVTQIVKYEYMETRANWLNM